MDGTRFDSLAKTLSALGPRRRALGGLLAGAFSLLGLSAEEAIAHDLKVKCKKKSGEAKKKCLKKAKKHAAQHASETAPPPSGGCPSGQKPCNGSCILTSQCCVNADCWLNRANQGDGQVCQNGTCTCTVAGTRQCPNLGGRCGSCCQNSDCSGGKVCTNNTLPRPFACECDRFNSNANLDCGGKCIPASCGSQACGANCTNNPNVCCAPLTCTVDSLTTKACL